MEMDGAADELRFGPSALEAVTHFLPRLISGDKLDGGADRLIHRADVFGCEPRVLAAEFAPVPMAGKTHDRYFFTTCKRLKGKGSKSARVAGAGTWSAQTTKDIKDAAGVKVGEIKKLAFQKNKVGTGWLMEEYRLPPEDQQEAAGDGVKVMCRIYLSPKEDSAARQESAACACARKAEAKSALPPQPEPLTTKAPKKRPAPAVPVDPPCPKCARAALPTYAPPPPPAYAPPPVALPDTFTETPAPAADEGDDGDQDRFVFTMDELLGVFGEDLPAEPEDQQAAAVLAMASDGFGAIPTSDDFGDIFDDLPIITPDNLDMAPTEQCLPVLTNDDESSIEADNEFNELLGRYKPRTIFTSDRLDRHSAFLSSA